MLIAAPYNGLVGQTTRGGFFPDASSECEVDTEPPVC